MRAAVRLIDNPVFCYSLGFRISVLQSPRSFIHESFSYGSNKQKIKARESEQQRRGEKEHFQKIFICVALRLVCGLKSSTVVAMQL